MQRINGISRRWRLLVLLVMILITGFMIETDHPPLASTDKTPFSTTLIAEQSHVSPLIKQTRQYLIQSGDTLGTIFERLGYSQNSLYQLLEADLNLLALDTIKPGQVLLFTKLADQLIQVELQFNLVSKVVYTRKDTHGFEFKMVTIPSEWRPHRYSGEIEYSFTRSMQKAGLALVEAQLASGLLRDKIGFRSEIRPGDKFNILISRQYVGEQATGANHIEAVVINNQRSNISAYLYEGSYYDEQGQSIEKSFIRYPFKGSYRISSAFKPKRHHPITGLLCPHNGIDFATPLGTSVLATGDGVVTRVLKHKYAGIYVELSHGKTYRSRYLHLSKALVKKGQRVKRGQKIALSGNTGRSTGPHLHYEFHINGKAVNGVTADIPMAKSISKNARTEFDRKVEHYQAYLAGEMLTAEVKAMPSKVAI